jgi:hypothetical protein
MDAPPVDSPTLLKSNKHQEASRLLTGAVTVTIIESKSFPVLCASPLPRPSIFSDYSFLANRDDWHLLAHMYNAL